MHIHIELLSLTPNSRCNLGALGTNKAVVDAFEVRSMLDCACGDATWLWGSEAECLSDQT